MAILKHKCWKHVNACFLIPWCDSPEPLLARGIPDLQLDGLPLQLDCPDLEVHADRGDVRLGVGVVRKPEQQAGLSHAGVANQQELEQVVARRDGFGLVIQSLEEVLEDENWG